MSKNFEEEYKEYLNAQAPDLWSRIEAGVDALDGEAAEVAKVFSIAEGKSKKGKKKRRINYQHYRAIASVAACLFVLILLVPVYFLARTSKIASDNAAQAPVELTDATIQNIEVASETAEETVEESAPMEAPAEEVAEVEVDLTEIEESVSEMAQADKATDEAQFLDSTGGSVEEGMQVTTEESAPADEEDLFSQVEEESVAPQEDMQVSILGEGKPQEDGVMYTAVVVGSTSSATISLFAPTESSIVLEADKVYDVTVELSEDGTYYVMISVTAAE